MHPKFQSYQLHILITEELYIQIGRLGIFLFPAGNYIYTGSAKTNLESRIKRHYSSDKKIRWHIDYLLSNKSVKIVQVGKHEEPECVINKQNEGKIVVPKFGASDCRNNCGSHLKYLGDS